MPSSLFPMGWPEVISHQMGLSLRRGSALNDENIRFLHENWCYAL